MTWEEKLAAIQALRWGAGPKMRSPGNWYVGDAPGIIEGDFYVGVGGSVAAPTPETAVEEQWKRLTEGAPLVVASPGAERGYRWNGYMWKEEQRA